MPSRSSGLISGLRWARVDPDILLKTEARYSSEVQQRALAITDVHHPNMWPTLDFNQPSRSTPVARDQMVFRNYVHDRRSHDLRKNVAIVTTSDAHTPTNVPMSSKATC